MARHTFFKVAGMVCVIAVGACSSADDSFSSSAYVPSGQTLPNDQLYNDLPTGPNNSGAFPDMRDDPVARIQTDPSTEVAALTAQLEALERDHARGRISPAVYQRRLAGLRRLAARHSPEMLSRIDG